MTEQTSRASLFTKLAIISAAIPPIKPTGYNQDTKKAYADADDITAALKSLLGEHNIAIVMQINSAVREDTGQRTGSGSPYIRTSLDCTFIIADGETGETIVCPWSAEAADHMKDKGLPKALTIARRTFLIHTFGLITGEERQLWEKEERTETRQPQQQRQQPAPRPARTEYVPAADEPPADTMQDKLKKLASLRTQAAQAKIAYTPPKPIASMSALELDTAINALEMQLGAKVGGILPLGQPGLVD